MTPDDRTVRTPPPSFAPASGVRPADPAQDEPIVVGRSTTPAGRPTTPPGRPAAPAARSAGPRSGAAPASIPPSSAELSGRPAAAPIEVPGTRPPARPVAPVRTAGSTPRSLSSSSSSASAPSRPSTPAAGSPSRPSAPAAIPPGTPQPATAPRTTSSRPSGQRPAVRPLPAGSSTPPTADAPERPHRRRWPLVALVAVVVVAALLAWPIGLVAWANGKVQHTSALSGAPNTPGTTYLLTGSDSRADGSIGNDGTQGARTDTILLLQVPVHGPTALISLPRDTYVAIPGHGSAKLNAAYSWGQAPLLVKTVEGLTGLTIDHYAEIGMGGVEQVVNAVGGVSLCYGSAVNDVDSGMVWTPGCHDVNGAQALAFSRMRKSDPTGDVGRAQRQRQLISAVMGKVKPTSLVFHPSQQVELIDAGTAALTVSDGTGIVDLGKLALAFRAANGPGGVTGTPPIKSLNYRPGNVGSTVELDPKLTPAFWVAVRDGTLPAGPVGGMPTG